MEVDEASLQDQQAHLRPLQQDQNTQANLTAAKTHEDAKSSVDKTMSTTVTNPASSSSSSGEKATTQSNGRRERSRKTRAERSANFRKFRQSARKARVAGSLRPVHSETARSAKVIIPVAQSTSSLLDDLSKLGVSSSSSMRGSTQKVTIRGLRGTRTTRSNPLGFKLTISK